MKPFSLEEYLKNHFRKVITRDGRNVTIHCTDFDDSEYPIIARVEGTSVSTSFTKDGKYIKFNGDSKYDLFFAPEKHEGWVNVFKEDKFYNVGNLFSSKEDALAVTKGYNDYVATVKIEWEE